MVMMLGFESQMPRPEGVCMSHRLNANFDSNLLIQIIPLLSELTWSIVFTLKINHS